jgi:hypothetical protein
MSEVAREIAVESVGSRCGWTPRSSSLLGRREVVDRSILSSRSGRGKEGKTTAIAKAEYQI